MAVGRADQPIFGYKDALSPRVEQRRRGGHGQRAPHHTHRQVAVPTHGADAVSSRHTGRRFFLPYRVEDSADSDRTFKQFDAVAMVSNNSKYFGYIVSTNAGVSRRNKEYENSEIGTVGDEEFVSAFVNVIVGFEAE